MGVVGLLESKKKQSVHDPVSSTQIDDGSYKANMAIQDRFYDEGHIEDNIDNFLSDNSNIGAVLLPKKK